MSRLSSRRPHPYASHPRRMVKVVVEKWRYNSDRDIETVVGLLRHLLASTEGVDHCRKLMWDMHLIHHRFDETPHKKGYNRFAGLHAKHKEVWRRVGEAVSYLEYTQGSV